MNKQFIKSEKLVEICASFSEISKQQLLQLFSSIPGQKELALHPDIFVPLDRICGAAWLKSNNIDKFFRIDSSRSLVPYEAPTVIYITYPDKTTTERMLDEIMLDPSGDRKYHVVFVPLIPYDIEDILESNGIHERVTLHSLQLLPVQLDAGLLTLEVPNIYRDLFVERDLTHLACFSRAIYQLCQVFGTPDVWVEIGEHACAVRTQVEADLRSCVSAPPAVHAVVIMDRSADYASALLLPSTYAALLAEVYRPKCGVLEHKVDPNTSTEDVPIDERTYTPAPRKQWPSVKLYLDGDTDSIYNSLKYRPFPEAMASLVNLLKQAATSTSSFQDSAAAGRMSVADMKSFVENSLRRTDNVKKHDRAAETIIRTFGDKFERRTTVEADIVNGTERHEEFIHETLASGVEPYEALRLFCLASVTRGYQRDGAKARSFLDCFFTQHGYHHLPLQSRLFKAEFLVNSPGTDGKRNLFSQGKSRWKQVSSDDVVTANSPSYVFGGTYSPLIAQVVAAVATGARVSDLQDQLKAFAHNNIEAPSHAFPLRERTFIVVIIGGVTYSEVAALQLLEQITGSRIIVLSDKVVTGNDIVDALLDTPESSGSWH